MSAAVVRVAGRSSPGLGTMLWREHQALLGRWLARLRREPLTIAALLAQPMVWLLLFGHLFAGLAGQPDELGGATCGS